MYKVYTKCDERQTGDYMITKQLTEKLIRDKNKIRQKL